MRRKSFKTWEHHSENRFELSAEGVTLRNFS